jgi:UDP-N-acetylglucosamine 2-epimerase (hydrolysing)
MIRKIVFLTGTRADFGKIKSLIQSLVEHADFEPYLFVTGMHLMHEYGFTVHEIEKSGFKNIHQFENHTSEATMDLTLSKTIVGFSEYIKGLNPDLIVVHGDRVEALAGAITGSLNNLPVAHIEGGEISGTIDELIRHAVSKLSHLHFVSNQNAASRLVQMGENPKLISVIGSPDLDIMISDQLPSIKSALDRYEIGFTDYAVVLFHPVTTEVERFEGYVQEFVTALKNSGDNYLVIYPNNDLGSAAIIKEYKSLKGHSNFRVLPSVRFEYFLVLLRNAKYIVGNSSAGIREAPFYGVPTVNVGSRQQNRSSDKNIINCDYASVDVLKGIGLAKSLRIESKTNEFGDGDSASKFIEFISNFDFENFDAQKQFLDLERK